MNSFVDYVTKILLHKTRYNFKVIVTTRKNWICNYTFEVRLIILRCCCKAEAWKKPKFEIACDNPVKQLNDGATLHSKCNVSKLRTDITTFHAVSCRNNY